jgi:hypothetical protein
MLVGKRRKLRDDGKMYGVSSSDWEGEAIFHSACPLLRPNSFISYQYNCKGPPESCGPEAGDSLL